MQAPPLSRQRDHLQDRIMEVETPERVAIEYALAGLGSRFAALLADLLLVVLLHVGLVAIVLIATILLELSFAGGVSGGWTVPILVLASFGISWGYFFFFEAFQEGQTPGKRWMSLRVVMDGGYPVTVEAAAVRNLLRPVDLLGAGLVGGFVMLLSPRAKRLGDLAASTVVVRELPVEFPDTPPPGGAASPPRLSEPGFGALERYIDRRSSLEPAVAARLAGSLLRRLDAVDAVRPGEPADAYLARFYAEEEERRRAARLAERAGAAAAAAFVRAKRSRWEEFRLMTARVRRQGLAALGEEGVGDFAARYRELTADLARARTYGGSLGTMYALERLVGAAHNLFYRPARQSMRKLMGWLWRGFPSLVRRRWVPITSAALLLYLPGFLSFFLLVTRPEMERQLVPVELIERAEEAPERRARGEGYIDVPLSHAFLASAVISNNLQVAFFSFALGVTAGAGTAVVLILNGLHLGSVLAVFGNRGALDVIGVFVLPHGVLELTAICIAGGAGLWMGSGLLLPRRKTRRAAFVERAREGVSLIAGVILLLLLAGLIEGFVSPAPLPASLKIAVSGLTTAALLAYFFTAGRGAGGGGRSVPPSTARPLPHGADPAAAARP